jgi:hypothetical protein
MMTTNRLAVAIAGSLLLFSVVAGASTASTARLPAGATRVAAADAAASQPQTAKPDACKDIKNAHEKEKCEKAAAKAAKEHKPSQMN